MRAVVPALLLAPLALVSSLGLACGGATPSAAQAPTTPGAATPAAPTPATPTAPRGELVDSAEFVLTISGEEIGRETSEIRRHEGGFEVSTKVAIAVAGLTVEGVLRTDAAHRPIEGRWSGQAGGGELGIVLRKGDDGLFETVVSFGGRQEIVRATQPIDLYMADNHMMHMAQLCRVSAGSPAAGGKQTIFPGLVLTYGAARAVAVGGRAIAVRDVDFGGQLSMQIACEGERLVGVHAGLMSFLAVRQGDADIAPVLVRKPRDKPPLPTGVVEEERAVPVPAAAGIGEAVLGCSFMRPAEPGKQKLPAVVFITGSGAQDRDEDTVGPGGLKMAIFKVVAIRLAQAGIASLRCDDLGTGKSTGDFARGTRQVFTTLVALQVAALRAEPTVDKQRVGLVGHSEGGLIAPLAALADPSLRAIALMAGPGRVLDVIVIEQTEAGLRAAGVDEATVAREVARTTAVFAAWRAGAPLPAELTPEQKAIWAESEAWFRSYLDHDPAVVARRLGKVAVFIAQGGKDQQVRVVDADLLGTAFAAAKNKRVTKKIYPALNHLFVASATGNFAEYDDPDASVDETFLADLVAFLAKNL